MYFSLTRKSDGTDNYLLFSLILECLSDSHCPASKPACNPSTSHCIGNETFQLIII